MQRVGFTLALAAGLLVSGPVTAQQGASFRLEESAFNAGGHPENGVTVGSASFRITLHSIGQGVTAPTLTGVIFDMEGGLVAGLAPPIEVRDLRFTGPDELVWDPDRSVGDYALYRGTVSNPFDPSYGSCRLPNPVEPFTVEDTTPVSGEVLFYLVTARNRLREESTKGRASNDVERANPFPCP